MNECTVELGNTFRKQKKTKLSHRIILAIVEIKMCLFAKYAEASSDIDSLFASLFRKPKTILPTISREILNE